MDTGAPIDRNKSPQATRSVPGAIGETAAKAEAAAIEMGTNRVYRFRMRHPWIYGLLAFIIGSGVIGIFTMTTYTSWTYEGIDLKTAVYQLFFGSLAGGIVMVVLAFAYARTVRSVAPFTRKDVTANEV